MNGHFSRRAFLRKAVVGVAATSVLAACQPKVVEKIVKETVEVEKVVKETVEVEKLVKETVVVDAAEPAPKEPIMIRYHAFTGEQEIKLNDIQAPKYKELHPHVTIEYEHFPMSEYPTKIATMHAGGTLGDVVRGAVAQTMIHFFYGLGVVQPADEYVASTGENLDDYYPHCIRALTIEGDLVGLPFKTHPGMAVTYYNENLFEAAGVPLPTPEWTHDDQVEAAKAIQAIAGDQPIFGAFLQTNWKGLLTMIRSFGGEMINEDGTKLLLNTDAGIAAIQRLYDFHQTYKVSPGPDQLIGDSRQMWASGLLGMMQDGTSAEVLKSTIGNKFKWMAVNNPIGPGGVGGSDTEVGCFSLTTSSKNPSEAFDWIRFLCSQESGILLGLIGGTISGRPDVYGSPVLLKDNPMRAVFKEIMDNAQDYRTMANWREDECSKALVQLLQPLWAGQEKPTKEFIDSVTAQIQTIVDMPRP